MSTLWFVVPVHGRLSLAAICLRQLRRTCDRLADHDIAATAVIVTSTDDLVRLRQMLSRPGLPALLGFGHVLRDNQYLSRRFNDGIQLATDPAFNPRPADYVVPIGSDDWIDHRVLVDLPGPDTIVGFQRLCFVRDDGLELRETHVQYLGGCGMRIYPRELIEQAEHRPADEDRKRGCDTSILTNLRALVPDLRVEHRDTDPRQIVDWKSPSEQINTFDEVIAKWGRTPGTDPFEALDGVFPAEALDEMAGHYGVRRLVAA